jgi:eukaryotic-like serine/threonine-protein kinase
VSLLRRLVRRLRGDVSTGPDVTGTDGVRGSAAAAAAPTELRRAEAAKTDPMMVPSSRRAEEDTAQAPRPSASDRLRAARGTREEARVVAELLEQREELDDPSRLALAELLAMRGEELGALELLERSSSPRALLMRADLHATRGRLADALGAIERVLARDISTPGALERQQRWSRMLGASPIVTPVSDDATLVLPPATASPFVIRRELARGGGGAVYEAEDPILLRRVALKVHHGESRARRAASHEVELAELLRGPGVVRVVDASPDEGWVAMEWARLGSVRDLLRSGDLERLLPPQAWLLPLAAVLARVHRAGWVHYDIKPANVLLAGNAEIWLTDFGIARPIDAPGGGGSPGYLSPERLGGAPATPSDDVYGFGRIVEDLSSALGPEVARAPFERLAELCLGPLETRPASGEQLVAAARNVLAGSYSGA